MKKEKEKQEPLKPLEKEDENTSWLVNAVTGPQKKSPKTIWII